MTLRDLVAWSLAGSPSARRAAALAAVCAPPFHSAPDTLELLLEYLRPVRAGMPTPQVLRDAADRALAEAARCGITAVGWCDREFPEGLRAIPDPPPVLWIRGNTAVLSPDSRAPAVAIVGSRAASHYGREVAERLGHDLAAAGVVIVSGLARGCDAAAHAGALRAKGQTVAVLGCGADRAYPSEHRAVAARIAEAGGAIVSELAPGTPPLPSHFPRRNRIISGLARATVVVEASNRSGSLITASYALEQGRAVMAVPGSVLGERSRGCHALLRDGACLVEGAGDVLDELGVTIPACAPEPMPNDPILKEMTRAEELSVDELTKRTGLAAPDLLPRLLQLEMAGRVRRAAGGRFVRVSR